MLLTATQLDTITDSVFEQLYQKIKQLVYTKNACYELPDLLDLIGMKHLFPTLDVPEPEIRILVLGASQVNEDDLTEAAESLGFSPSQIDFCCDYAKLCNFDLNRIKDSNKYDYIFVAPIPHKIKGIEKAENLITYITENQSRFPKLICLSSDENEHHLKLTRTNFLHALNEVLMLENILD